MNNIDIPVAAFALALTRHARLSPGAVTKVMLSIPSSVEPTAQDLSSWYAETKLPESKPVTMTDIEDQFNAIESTVNMGISALIAGSPQYPDYLLKIADAPPVLYVRGNVSVLNECPGVAIVGTRKASANGIVIAERISSYFADKGWTIVSGLALGIDAAAHRGALAVQGKTIAVLAHGLKNASPRTNAHLGSEILENGGAWVSEYPIDVTARPEQFILRNRIQIGLSAGSIIVEGEERSGTMTQAEFCLQNKRKLFAVLPASADKLKLVSAGPTILVNKRGATVLRSKDDYDSAMMSLQHVKDNLAGLPA